jgi:SNF2 family DNA or RNA helicase
MSVLTELYEADSLNGANKLKLAKLRIVQLQLLEQALNAAKLRWLGGEKLRRLGEKLAHFTGIQKIDAPKGLRTELRPYQQDGLSWLQFLREYELGGILADDMGLGKTVQALAHLLVEKNSGRMDRPSLVIAPTSLMVNWYQEAERFTPALKILTLHGSERKPHFNRINEYDVVLTTYPLLIRDQETLLSLNYHVLIIDEAQFIKNPRTKINQIVQKIQARHRLCLTGTPMENHLGELWALFNFLLPGLLGDNRQFHRLFRVPIEKHHDKERSANLWQRIQPFFLRRTKQQVLQELPPKIEMHRSVELEGAQRDLYESIRIALHQKVASIVKMKGLANSQIIILDALLKLRQTCCDPRLLKMESAQKIAAGSAKLQMLMEMLPNLIAEGRRILLFSQFTQMLELIEAELHKAKISYVKLTGKTKDRATPIAQFQAGEVSLFLISLKAGGTGLNLTAADAVIHYDPWWNPAVEKQATDRTHRIGQDKTVFVYKLITSGTVEEKILQLQQHKHALLENLLSHQGDIQTGFKLEDLEVLFEPLPSGE